jgi:acyl-coenzyme A synthetase/AMP-(fatty) acid ligase
LLDSYGNTEVGFLYIANRSGDGRRGSVGRPIDGIQIQITNARGELVSPGEIGKLRVRGPSVIERYWNDPQRTQDAFQEGWFVTSDIFSVDGDGFYFMHGRADHMIKLGCGDWVNPIELEAVLLEHHSVRECAIIGAQDSQGLTMLKALVVVHDRESIGRGMASELSELIRGRWPRQEYKHVGIVEFTNLLPKTTAGKLDRSKLRSQSMTEFSYKC